jgi:addiction module HigA family antidote
MTMKNPQHPGRSIRSACLEPLGLSISQGAKILGVTRQALNKVIVGKSARSPVMAIRLTKAFGSTEETWLRMQLAYDLAMARKEERKIKVRRQHVPQELQSSDARLPRPFQKENKAFSVPNSVPKLGPTCGRCSARLDVGVVPEILSQRPASLLPAAWHLPPLRLWSGR